MSGSKIIKGLKQALAGDFERVTIDGQTWVRAPQWQPIETAPNDGRLVLVCGGRFMQPETALADGDWRRKKETKSMPTNWMPIPTPPESS